jgi:hypothetical protein
MLRKLFGIPLAAIVLFAAAACQDSPVAPTLSQEGEGDGALSSRSPKSFILPIGTDLRPLESGTRSLGLSANMSIVYNAIPDPFPGSYPSLGYEATSTDEFGDLVALTRPGVASTVTVGMNDWACENDGSRAGNEACESSEGSSYPHDLTLNLYSVDYSGSTPGLGALIATVTQTFDVPFRPSWDSENCTATGEEPSTNQPFGGKWYAADLDACVNGYAFAVTFDLSGLDVVLPPEVIYGVAYNTQHYGEDPIETPGPYNSLNVGLANLSPGSLGQPTVGSDVEVDAVFWDTSHGPFYCDAGTAGVDVFRRDGDCWDGLTPIIAMAVTNEGHVTGGGWFTSQAGAYNGTDGDFIVNGNPDDGWVFNAEPPFVTAADFTADEASIGMGSLRVDPITNSAGNNAKFILRYVPDSEILASDLAAFSIDFLIDDAGTSTDANQFYINLYTLTPDPDDGSWYDCRFDYVATSGSTSSWTPLAFDPTTVATAVGDNIGGACPSSLDGMPPGTTVLFISINLGDTSGNDSGVGGYFDNANLTVDNSTSTFDFETGFSGRASFAFSSRYQKGASVPSGNTQFTFQAGDLSLHSTAYDWLVVNQGGSNAQFKGTGTINQLPSPTGDDFKFMVWAGDGTPDTFRIKVFYEDGGIEHVIYDNGFDQAIEGGQIVVHKGK